MTKWRVEIREPLGADRPTPLVRLAAGTIVAGRAMDFGRHIELIVDGADPPQALHKDARVSLVEEDAKL